MAIQIKVKQGKGKTAVQEVKSGKPAGPPKETVEPVGELLVSDGPFANVGMSIAQTINVGDYNSVRVEVSLHMPCEPNEEAINETQAAVQEWIDSKVGPLAQEIREAYGLE